MNGYLKAIYGAVTAALSVLGTALTDGHVTTLEWVGVVSAAVLAFGAVYGVTNTTPPPPKIAITGMTDPRAVAATQVALEKASTAAAHEPAAKKAPAKKAP